MRVDLLSAGMMALTLALCSLAAATDASQPLSEAELTMWLSETLYSEAGEKRIQAFVDAGVDRKTAEDLSMQAFRGLSSCIVDSALAEVDAAGQTRQSMLTRIGDLIGSGGTLTNVLETLVIDDAKFEQRAVPCFFAVAQETGISLDKQD